MVRYETFLNEIGQGLRDLRESKNYSFFECAKAVSVDRKKISLFESGMDEKIKVKDVYGYVSHFSTSFSSILDAQIRHDLRPVLLEIIEELRHFEDESLEEILGQVMERKRMP
jgi:transcriptional regulator with XRE-family HTH domain